MNKLSSLLQPGALLGLLVVARFGYGPIPPAAPLAAATPDLAEDQVLLLQHPPGTYVLAFSQVHQQWHLPLAVK